MTAGLILGWWLVSLLMLVVLLCQRDPQTPRWRQLAALGVLVLVAFGPPAYLTIDGIMQARHTQAVAAGGLTGAMVLILILAEHSYLSITRRL